MKLIESLLGHNGPSRLPWQDGKCRSPFDTILSLGRGQWPEELVGIDTEDVSVDFSVSMSKSLAWLVELDCADLSVPDLYVSILALADWLAEFPPRYETESWHKTLLILLPCGEFNSGLSVEELEHRMRVELMASGLILYRICGERHSVDARRPLLVLRKVDQYDLRRLRTITGAYCRKQLGYYFKCFAADLSRHAIEEVASLMASKSEPIG